MALEVRDAIEVNLGRVQTRAGALKVLRRVVDGHRADPGMEDYRFFEEQMSYARYAANTLIRKANWPTLSAKDRSRVYYARRHFN